MYDIKRKASNEKTRIWMREYRKRKKEKEQNDPVRKLTRAEQIKAQKEREEKRKKWREYQAAYRLRQKNLCSRPVCQSSSSNEVTIHLNLRVDLWALGCKCFSDLFI
jgi:hypothetical protein